MLFIIFINDISLCFLHAKFLLYADDLKVYSVVARREDSFALQSDLDRVHAWCVKNRLFLNIDKCSHCIFSRKLVTVNTTYSIAGSQLKTVNTVKDLGVYFDSKLTFASHINFIVANSYSMLAFVRRNSSDFLDPYTHKKLFIAFVRSRLEYAAFIWRPAQVSYINRIERIQKIFIKFALRSLNFTQPLPSYTSRCLLLRLESLDNRRKYLSCSFIIKVITGDMDCPDILSRIPLNIPTRNLRHFDIFYLYRVKSNYAINAPISRALSELNQINRVMDIDLSLSGGILNNILLSYLNNN